MKTLIAEDDFVNRLLLRSFLAEHGECDVAVNGKEAVESFRRALVNGARYDLICMDMMMPEMDGKEAVRQVRAMEEKVGITSTRGVKIIMITAAADIKDLVASFKVLCDAYLVKPINIAELLEHLNSFGLVA